jgi:hypothetical protein
LGIHIDKQVLETACKNIIETILFSLPNAYKGTVYTIGDAPDLVATRITSGIIDVQKKVISWGLPERSDYNPPGKPWTAYRDEPGRALEAMAWCVEKQKSWTAEDPYRDLRSVRLQVEGILEDFHHMEPVLIRKEDLYPPGGPPPEYPLNQQGERIWRDRDYVVVAVIKIHFRPNTIKLGSPETKIIKRLSRGLGTELLSYQLREQSVEAMRRLAQDRLTACNILADSLRNTIAKSGLILSLIKLELGFLRRQWEMVFLARSSRCGEKEEAIQSLQALLLRIAPQPEGFEKELMDEQERFLEFSLPPSVGQNWVRHKIEDRWKTLLTRRGASVEDRGAVTEAIERLKASLNLGKDPELLKEYDGLSEALKREWTDLVYESADTLDRAGIERLIRILQDRSLDLPFKEKSRRSLIHLKTLAEVMDRLERDTNRVLREFLEGTENRRASEFPMVYNGLNSQRP